MAVILINVSLRYVLVIFCVSCRCFMSALYSAYLQNGPVLQIGLVPRNTVYVQYCTLYQKNTFLNSKQYSLDKQGRPAQIQLHLQQYARKTKQIHIQQYQTHFHNIPQLQNTLYTTRKTILCANKCLRPLTTFRPSLRFCMHRRFNFTEYLLQGSKMSIYYIPRT